MAVMEKDRPAARRTTTIEARVAGLEWPAIASALDAEGCATTGPLLTADECAALYLCKDETIDSSLGPAHVRTKKPAF